MRLLHRVMAFVKNGGTSSVPWKNVWIGLIVVILAAACSSGGGSVGSGGSVSSRGSVASGSWAATSPAMELLANGVPLATSAEITGPIQTIGAPGSQIQFSTVGKDSRSQTTGSISATWTSLDSDIVSIDATGLAKATTMGVTTLTATRGTLTSSVTVSVVSAKAGGGNFAFSGTAKYEDKPFTASGLTGALVQTPIRHAIVKVIAVDGFVKIAEGKTDSSGNFSFSNLNNSARKGGVAMYILPQTATGNSVQVTLKKNETAGTIFILASTLLDDSQSSVLTASVVATASSSIGIGGAFNIFDVLLKSGEFLQNQGAATPAALTAYWEPGSPLGTYYDRGKDTISIYGASTDSDEYDDMIIAHEYGHFVLTHFSHDQSPGGSHVITDNKQDIRLSWSEGWASYFGSAVHNSSIYVDTSANGVFSFDIETYNSPQLPNLASSTLYTTNEVSVAGILWDITDPSSSESNDSLQLGFDPVWQSVRKIQKTPTEVPATFESFWLQFSPLYASYAGALQTIMVAQKVELFSDAFENGEVALGEGATQHHTLYKSGLSDPTGDADTIPFTLQPGISYTLATLNLTNGADTQISITDTSNTNTFFQAYTSDNQGTTHLAARVTQFTCGCSVATLYHAHVKRSVSATGASGLFGSYDIQLTRT